MTLLGQFFVVAKGIFTMQTGQLCRVERQLPEPMCDVEEAYRTENDQLLAQLSFTQGPQNWPPGLIFSGTGSIEGFRTNIRPTQMF